MRPPGSAALDFLADGGELGALMRAHDWQATPLGPPETWPQSLRTLVGVMLGSTQPMLVVWGPERILLYNNGYAPILGQRHPGALGRSFAEVWSEVWDELAPLFARADAGESTHMDDIAFTLHRNGYPEEAHFAFSCTPVRDSADALHPGGRIAGLFCTCTETTEKVHADRRLAAEGDHLRRLFEQAPGFMCVLRGPEHRFEFVNAAYLQLVGHRDLLGKSAREALPEVEGQGFFELLDRVYATGEPFIGRSAEIVFQADGASMPERRLVDFVYQPITDDVGRVSGIFVEGSDVTERTEAEARLRASEARLTRLLATTPAGIIELDAEGCFAYANATAEAMLGAEPGGLMGRRYDDSAWQLGGHDGAPIPPDRTPGAWALRGEAVTDYAHAITTLDGRRVMLLVDVAPVRAEEGHVKGALAAFQDVTARHAQAQALRESELRFRGFAENVTDVLWIVNAETRQLEYLSPSYEEIWGEPRKRIIQDLDHWAELVHPDDRAGVSGTLPRVLAGETCTVEYRIVRTDGAVRWICDTGFPIPGADGRVRRAGGVAQDITERKRAETELAVSASKLRAALEIETVGVMYFDTEGRLVGANDAFLAMCGYGRAELEAGLLTWCSMTPPEWVGASERAFAELKATGRTTPYEKEYVRKDGTRWWGLFTAKMLSDDVSIEFVIDIAERKRAEAALRQLNEALEARIGERTAELMAAEATLRQAQKMEAVGQLTGGIAHDFNNMLQAIGGSLEMMRRRVGQGRAAEAMRYVEGASRTVERAASLTHRLLAFARRQALQPRPVEPGTLIEGMAELIRRTVGPSITVELRGGEGIWTVLCDPNQLENVLLNLAINARDAMPEGGALTIATKDVRLGKADVAGQEAAAPGDYVEITVSDAGTGMDEATQARAFEPFFTTKPIGQGTGLGLSQAYGFVRQSDGVVRLESAPGQGTTVQLYLPRHADAREPEEEAGSGQADAPQGGASETVLLVEDEVEVREVAADALRELGYSVLEAANGAAALRVLHASRGSRVDLLVTDVGLPGGLNGRQLADAARERRPGLPVLFITGYAGSALEGHLAPGMAVIGKPFTLDALVVRVRAMLEGAPAT